MSKTINQITSIQSLDELSALELASFINLLIKHETKPGGPYKFKASAAENLALNNHIYHLFSAKGKKLNPEMLTGLQNKTVISKKSSNTLDLIHDTVLKDLETQFDNHTLSLINAVALKIKDADHSGEISQLSNVFYESLKSNYRKKIQFTESIRHNYSLANVYTWITYTIIDKMLDSTFEPHLLPSTYILQRNIADQYKNAGVNTELISHMFNIVDQANTYELSIRNFLTVSSDYNTITVKSLSLIDTDSLMWRKSIAHTTGVISIAEKVKPESVKHLHKAMQLYCSARQLNDDVHDWQEDLSKGQITYAIGELLKKTGIKPGKHSSSDLLSQLKLTYWNDTLAECSKRIQKDIHEAITILEDELLEVDSEFTRLFLIPISDAAKQAAEQNNYEKHFLKSQTN